MAEAGASDRRPELREALLASATRMFLERPYGEVRVDDVVADAGVAKGLAFYYFGSKRGLYAAVVQSLMAQLVARTMPDPALPPRQREVAAVESFVEWAAETKGVENILSTWSAGDAEVDAVFRETADRIIEQVVAGMSDMPGGPGTKDELPRALLSRSIWGWLAFARIVTADWLRKRDMEPELLRDLLVGALDGVVATARAVGARPR
jgi:AcrR family transcriptional regulator